MRPNAPIRPKLDGRRKDGLSSSWRQVPDTGRLDTVVLNAGVPEPIVNIADQDGPGAVNLVCPGARRGSLEVSHLHFKVRSGRAPNQEDDETETEDNTGTGTGYTAAQTAVEPSSCSTTPFPNRFCLVQPRRDALQQRLFSRMDEDQHLLLINAGSHFQQPR